MPTEANSVYRQYITELSGFCASLVANGFRLRIVITSSPDEPAIDDLMEAIRLASLPGNQRHCDTVEISDPRRSTTCAHYWWKRTAPSSADYTG